MYSKIKVVIRDTLFVSKVTKTNKKKITILYSVFLSQLIAFSDILIILLFTKLFSNTNVLPEILEAFEILFEIKILLPLTIVLRYFIQYLQSIVLKKLEYNVQANLKIYMLEEIFKNRNYSTVDTYYYVNTLSNHISYFYSSIAMFLNFTLQSIAFTLYLFVTEPSTISAFLAGIVFLIYPIYYLIIKSRKYEQYIYEKGLESSSDIQRVVENSFLIKLLKKEKDEVERYSKIIKQLYRGVLTKHKLDVLNSYLPPFVTVFLISIIAIFFNNYFLITLSFMGVTLRMFQSLANVSSSTNQIINSHVHLKTFYDMQFYKKSTLKENYVALDKPSSENIIGTTDVNFKYFNSEETIFNNLNIKIKRNSHTAFTGVNGSGKSTILGILAGVYYPNNGSVKAFSKKLGFVGPNPLIFSGTLRENLLYGNNSEITDEKIKESVTEFSLFGDEQIIDLEKKIDNKSLSSGQMQKIGFLRIILSEVDILFLDESTSNLDEETKNLIFEILKKKNLTIINSTHDLESFKTVDSHYKVELKKGNREVRKIF